MTNSEIITSLALVVSCASFIVSYLSFRRTTKVEEPNGWAEVEPLEQANQWRVKIFLKNPTRYPFRIESISVPINRIPIDEKQDFLLFPSVKSLRPHTEESLIEAAKTGEFVGAYVKMPISEITVRAGSEGSVEAYMKRGTLSTASEAILKLHYWVMLERPGYRTLTVRARIPSEGVTLQVSRTN